MLALILARALQGCGAAFVTSAGTAILSDAFPGPARAGAFATWGSVLGSSIAFGPLVGGFIVTMLGWRSIFRQQMRQRHPVGPQQWLGAIIAVFEGDVHEA